MFFCCFGIFTPSVLRNGRLTSCHLWAFFFMVVLRFRFRNMPDNQYFYLRAVFQDFHPLVFINCSAWISLYIHATMYSKQIQYAIFCAHMENLIPFLREKQNNGGRGHFLVT